MRARWGGPRVALVAATMVVAIGLAGCGSGDDAKTSSSTEPIQLFQIAPLESQVYSATEIAPSAQAAVQRINEAGGVNGRPLKLTSCNDEYDPNEALRCAKKATQEGAVAVVGSLTAYADQTSAVLESRGIPLIAPHPLSLSDFRNKLTYLIDPGIGQYAASAQILAEHAGVRKIAILSPDNPSAALTTEFFEKGAAAAGVEVVDNVTIAQGTVDLVPLLQKVYASGAEGIVDPLAPNDNIKVWSALDSAGLVDKLPLVVTGGSTPDAIIQQAPEGSTRNSYAVTDVPSLQQDAPYIKEYLADMKALSPKITPTSVGLRAWASVKLFAQVASGIDGEIDSASVVAAFDKVHDLKFMWVDSLSYDEPGPVAELPRLVNPEAGASKIENGTQTPLGRIDPFG